VSELFHYIYDNIITTTLYKDSNVTYASDIRKFTVEFLFVITELFSLAVIAKALRVGLAFFFEKRVN